MVNQQTRQISILCFRVVLFEVVREILFDFPHGPSKNVKCHGFFCPFLSHTFNQTMAAVIDMDPSMCSNKGGSSRKKRKENVFFWTTQAVGIRANQISCLGSGFIPGKKKSLVRQRFSGKLMFCLRFREACEPVTSWKYTHELNSIAIIWSQKFKPGVSFVGYPAVMTCDVVVTNSKDRKNKGVKMPRKRNGYWQVWKSDAENVKADLNVVM